MVLFFQSPLEAALCWLMCADVRKFRYGSSHHILIFFFRHGSFGCDYTSIPNGTFSNPGGSVADVVPFMHVGGWPGDPSWGSISSVLPYTVWKGGDDGLVADYYNGAKRNVDFFIREAGADGLIEFGYYGDWLQLEKTDKPQVTSTAQIMSTSHLVEMAVHLGKTADAAAYNASLAKMKLAYHAKYWNVEEQSYHGVTPCRKPSCPAGNTGSQTANLMPLILDIPPPKERAMAAAALVASVQAKRNATSSGLVGASFILQALVQAGKSLFLLNKNGWGGLGWLFFTVTQKRYPAGIPPVMLTCAI